MHLNATKTLRSGVKIMKDKSYTINGYEKLNHSFISFAPD
jgi:hypothetical protein